MNQIIKIDDTYIDNNIVTIEEADMINASIRIINKDSVLNNVQLINKEKSNIKLSACNDNGPILEPTDIVLSPPTTENNEEDISSISIDIDNISTHTGIDKNELKAVCVGCTSPIVSTTKLPDLNSFITINKGYSNIAKNLANNPILKPEARNFFLKKAQSYSYLWLKGEAQLGNEIRAIRIKRGKRNDLSKVSFDEVLGDLRSKKEILSDDYNLTQGQARNLARLTDELVEKEYKYCLKNNEVPSRNHALTFLNSPQEMSKEEKDEIDVEKTKRKVKSKFNFETVFSDVPFINRKNRTLKKPIFYASIAACIGSDEYYLEDHGFVCKVALECDKDRAKYFESMHQNRSKHSLDMVVGKFEEKYDELVSAFKKNKCELAKFTIPCQIYCAMRGKDWKDDDRLLLVLWSVKFIKEVKPKYILFENAKEFLSFSFPLKENLCKHPIAQKMQKELNGRTIGKYLEDELGKNGEGYNLNFAIENAAFYGTAQNRIRSIILGSRKGIWKFPCSEKFAMSLWQAIGHLPSIEADEDSGIPYHIAPKLNNDHDTEVKLKEAFSHLATGCRSCDNDPKYQLSGFAYFKDKGARKFWDQPSNTIDGGNGSAMGNRTLHPGRLKKDKTYSDCRVLTLLEIFLTNGLPQSYEVPEEFKDKEAFIRQAMGEIFLPRLSERIFLELPIPESDWCNIDGQHSMENKY